MSVMYLRGGRPLKGELTVHGAKNSVLPILAACLLAGGPVTLHNCPRLTDVTAALDILRRLGCKAEQEGRRIVVDPTGAAGNAISEKQMQAMRSSIIFLGPLLARMGEAHLTYPGGCELGPRPIDLHLSAIRAMGCRITEDHGIHCVGRPSGGEVYLALPSVGATENAMLCAVGAAGITTISNAAREPEIGDLQSFLNSLGAHVRGAGSSTITVEGGQPLSGGEFHIMGDRIVAATLLSAAAAAGGQVRLRGIDWRHLATVLSVFHQAGCRVESRLEYVELERDRAAALKGVPTVRTAPYPGFPTDAQAILMAALAGGEGATLFVENIFDSRYRHVDELRRMGADIQVAGRTAMVTGVGRLHGASLRATDLRGGAALVVAALGAEGTTRVSELRHIRRGYQDLDKNLRALGADIREVP